MAACADRPRSRVGAALRAALLGLLVSTSVLAVAAPAMAQGDAASGAICQGLSDRLGPPPLSLEALKQQVPLGPGRRRESDGSDTAGLNLDIKENRDAALSYGMRGGLAWRTWETCQRLDGQAATLDRIWTFRSLAIAVPGSFAVVVPPVVTAADRSMAVAGDGKSATFSQKKFDILVDAKIASIAPDWRNYLYRVWQNPAVPDPLLLPRSAEEKKAWDAAVDQGWQLGIRQADEIFELDLNRLRRDFEGMVRFRELVARGLIRDIYLSATDLGVQGGGKTLIIGEQAVRITEPAALDPRTGNWRAYVIEEPAQ